MDAAIVQALAQFGVAGLIGWMWLTERRAAGDREQQLRELHQRVQEDRVSLGTLLKVLEENTRAIATLEATQRRLVDALERREPRGEPQPERVRAA